MKGKTLLTAVAARSSYIVLAVFVILFQLLRPGTLSNAFLLCAGCYIVLFEVYVHILRRNVKKVMKNTVAMLDLTSLRRLEEFPIPILISNSSGEVLWYSETFCDTFGEEYAVCLNSVYKIHPDILKNKTFSVDLAEGSYYVCVDCSVQHEKEMYVLYFFDRTDLVTLQQEHNDSKPVVAHILVDNYDELFKNVKESDRSVAMATIDDTISKWTQGTSCILRKIEKNRYFVIFENRYLNDFMKERFSILDTVRDLPILGSIPPTLSIGVGSEKDGFAESDEAARNALDMALSRGGDQAVVSKATGYDFFGGYARGNDRRAKITSRVLASSFAELLNSVKTVIVMGHQYADMDSLGACVGIACIGRSFGKKTHIILNPETNLAESLYDRLVDSNLHSDLFISKQDAMMTVDLDTLVVIVDTHRASYTEMPEIIQYAGKIAVIDHHRKSADFIQDTHFFFHEPYASSACEMVTELIEYLEKCRLSALEADALLAGIYLDTKNFSLKTGTCTFEASAYLRNVGASTVNVKLMFQTDVDTYKLKAELISKAEIYEKVYAVSLCDMETVGNLKIAASQAADEMLNIENVQAAFCLYVIKDSVYVSARSYGSVNVQLIMEKLGGGGHQTMAGCQLKDTNIKEGYIKLTNAIDAYIDEQPK
ncbi:MAG: DHH family phosphoesterase [Clostridia bacterium]|nr:DHH family phosphoesterase [Clostridia bacterium]